MFPSPFELQAAPNVPYKIPVGIVTEPHSTTALKESPGVESSSSSPRPNDADDDAALNRKNPRTRATIKVVDPNTGEDITEKIISKYKELNESTDVETASEHETSNNDASTFSASPVMKEVSSSKKPTRVVPALDGSERSNLDRSEPIRPFCSLRSDDDVAVQRVQPQVWPVSPEVRGKQTSKPCSSSAGPKLPEITCVYNENREIVEMRSDPSAVIEDVPSAEVKPSQKSRGSTASTSKLQQQQLCAAATIFPSMSKSKSHFSASTSESCDKHSPEKQVDTDTAKPTVILPRTATWGDKFSKAYKPISAATVIQPSAALASPQPETSGEEIKCPEGNGAGSGKSPTAASVLKQPAKAPVWSPTTTTSTPAAAAPTSAAPRAPSTAEWPRRPPPPSQSVASTSATASAAQSDKKTQNETKVDEEGFQVVKKKDKRSDKTQKSDAEYKVPFKSFDDAVPFGANVSSRSSERPLGMGGGAPLGGFRGGIRGRGSASFRGGRGAWGPMRGNSDQSQVSEATETTEVTINPSLQSLQTSTANWADDVAPLSENKSAGSWSSIVRRCPSGAQRAAVPQVASRPSWAVVDHSVYVKPAPPPPLPLPPRDLSPPVTSKVDYFDMPEKAHQSNSKYEASSDCSRVRATSGRYASPTGGSRDISPPHVSGTKNLSPLRCRRESPPRARLSCRSDSPPQQFSALRREAPLALRCKSISRSPSAERDNPSRSTYSAGFDATSRKLASSRNSDSGMGAANSHSAILQNSVSSRAGRPPRQLAVVNPMKYDE
jgi:hypothetical protein